MTKPTLLVLAAGMGSRFGGLKQMEPVGPGGETIVDYSVYDALRAGFGKCVFVIRREHEQDFRSIFDGRFGKRIPLEYAFQELDQLPSGLSVPPTRTKPWGTGQAILSAEHLIQEPFAAINADDFYGANSFRVLAQHLTSGTQDYALVGFVLRNTLSEFGKVSRGVCASGPDGYLQNVTERTAIEPAGNDATYANAEGASHPLSGDAIVSMNFWGFMPSVFDDLRALFVDFLKAHGREEKSEFYIPAAVNALITTGKRRCKMLRTPDSWFGMTYREDRPRVMESIRTLIARGKYPEKLWR